ncbi:arylesterase [Beggiatoa alba]|nr:arylesterase [Beggiatoa alba]
MLAISLPSVAENSLAGNSVSAKSQQTDSPVILILGDSLSASFGINANAGWVALLQQRLASENLPHQVVNASISGETTSGGLQRLTQALNQHLPKIVIIELGANDGLRGLSLNLVRQNLSRMIRASQQAEARVLLIGMRLPPNYGPRYTRDFEQIFVEIAEQHETGLVPFLLAKVATRRELLQGDGLHPTAAAQPQLLNTVWPQLLPLLGG